MMKKCSKCCKTKKLSDFYSHPKSKDGLDSRCKSCKKEYSRQYRIKNPEKVKKSRDRFKKIYKEETGGYAVYYLPEEHYAGFSNNLRQRMLDHKKNGRIVEGYEVVGIYKCPIEAHLTETFLHKMGYEGFQHKY